jgi:hypothetical protein
MNKELTMQAVVLNKDFGDFSAKIEKIESGYKLSWDDNMVNEWAEFYQDLSGAFARLATLIKISESYQ